ncbi:MAG TPA: twin-arginine translocase TatA/TatE family subunit [Pyrinomonadaceae bacterium]|jgi:sec-independent protein translocase protein TatA|nr:twin-arginine translocase TatA/TatE family subunit [Pyrinomonadaceae bacterium]
MLGLQILGLRAPELILIVVAVVLLFGASRLPQLAKSIGQSRKAFKDALREGAEEELPAAEPKKQFISNTASALSDEEILAEMQRRAEAKSKA